MVTTCRWILAFLATAACLSVTPAVARTWTNTEGKTIEADWIGMADGKVQLKRSDGRIVSVPLAKLSQADQKFAQEQAAAPAVEKAGSEGTAPPAVSEGAARPKRVPPQTGAFRLTAPEGFPPELVARGAKTTEKRPKGDAKEDVAENPKGLMNKDGSEPSWEVYVPPSYDNTLPYGVLAYINSGDSGGLVGGWNAVLDKHRIIWIGGNQSGNKQPTSQRYALAIDGVRRIREKYQIDPERIYVSGNSGGGRVCSQLMLLRADLFTGGYPHIGCNPYRNLPLQGNQFLASNLQVNPKLMKQAARQNRFVFLTGEKDFNREHTRLIFEQYKSDGFKYITYLEVPGMEHTSPNAEWFEKGIVALDAPLTQAAKATFTHAAKNEKGGLLGAALEGYGRAAVHGGEQEFAAEAKAKFDTLRKQYDEDLVKVESLIAAGETTEAKSASAQFRRRWSKWAEDDVKRMEGKIRGMREKK